jgi:hypothetical protein
MCFLLYVHQGELLLTVYMAEGQNASGEFRESTPYLWGAETNV